jgi:uncharacterized protein YaiL (DUF2058 family)
MPCRPVGCPTDGEESVSDLREQMLKAGLVSGKQVRQAKHQERVHRKEVGREGLEAERAAADQAFLARQEEKRLRDREREEARRRSQAVEERVLALQSRIRAGWIREATAGSKRFFFVVDGGRITYLDLSDDAVRRLQFGRAAVMDGHGVARGEYCLVDAATALSISHDHPELIRFWNRAAER